VTDHVFIVSRLSPEAQELGAADRALLLRSAGLLPSALCLWSAVVGCLGPDKHRLLAQRGEMDRQVLEPRTRSSNLLTLKSRQDIVPGRPRPLLARRLVLYHRCLQGSWLSYELTCYWWLRIAPYP
jgi:hypothetical protein